MTRRRRWLMIMSAISLLVAACSSGGDTTTTTAGETATTTTAAATTTTEAVEETTTTAAEAEPLIFGMILVGPQDDRGWSQAHREAGEYLEEKLGAQMIVLDKVNPADRPDTTLEQVVDDMIAQGAKLIFATSDDMRDGILAAAAAHPDVPMIWASGDNAWAEGENYRPDLTNLGNIMPKMEFGKMIAGCAAALKTANGSIGYVGPLINDETRRFVNAAYLGARYCYENYRGEDPAALRFAVNWIGFWFHIPGVTLDPTQVTNEFLDGGSDVVMSGIDTTEVIVRTGQRAAADEVVWAVPFDYRDACAEAPFICLGVPYFNWNPSYLAVAQMVIDGSFAAEFEWRDPNWSDINDPDESAVGFVTGEGLTPEESASLDEFIAGLADGSINLWAGPLNYQDGTVYVPEGETASDLQIWYTTQLLQGIDGASSAS